MTNALYFASGLSFGSGVLLTIENPSQAWPLLIVVGFMLVVVGTLIDANFETE